MLISGNYIYNRLANSQLNVQAEQAIVQIGSIYGNLEEVSASGETETHQTNSSTRYHATTDLAVSLMNFGLALEVGLFAILLGSPLLLLSKAFQN